jgi:hypothetical protein
MTELGPWDALTPHGAKALFDGFGAPWWVAGGWAIDLFVGRQSRDHGDIDLAILRRDQERLREYLTGWDIREPNGGALTPWQAGDLLTAPRFQFWVRRSPAAAWSFEVMLEDDADGAWLFRRSPSIHMPLDRIGRVTPDGIPYLSPEIALLYKANHLEIERNTADFDLAAPLLEDVPRRWLRDAITMLYPGHPWIEHLA